MATPKKWPKPIWDQLKSLTSNDLVKALNKKHSGWSLAEIKGAEHVFHNPNLPPDQQELVIHLHKSNKGGYGKSQLEGLLDATGWDEDDLKKLKLIKK